MTRQPQVTHASGIEAMMRKQLGGATLIMQGVRVMGLHSHQRSARCTIVANRESVDLCLVRSPEIASGIFCINNRGLRVMIVGHICLPPDNLYKRTRRPKILFNNCAGMIQGLLLTVLLPLPIRTLSRCQSKLPTPNGV